MQEVSWRTQIFSGFFLVCIALILLSQGAAILGFFGLSDSLGDGWAMQGFVVIMVVGIVFGNTRKEPTQRRLEYQTWLKNKEIAEQPSRFSDQY